MTKKIDNLIQCTKKIEKSHETDMSTQQEENETNERKVKNILKVTYLSM